jgi:hypothetical protein
MVHYLTILSALRLVKLQLLHILRADLPTVRLVSLQTHLDGSMVSHVANNERYSTDDEHSHGKPKVSHVQAIVDVGESAVETECSDRE